MSHSRQQTQHLVPESTGRGQKGLAASWEVKTAQPRGSVSALNARDREFPSWSAVPNPTGSPEVAGSIPGPAKRVKDLVLP